MKYICRTVTTQGILKGDRILWRNPDSRKRREYVGTACDQAFCSSADVEESMWKVYLDGGPIGRLFLTKNEEVVVMRPV